jgi:hypothetical protein
MDDYVDPMMLELERVAIGQPAPRSEDPVLLRGEGITPTTLSLPGQALHARFVPFLANSTMRRFGPDAALEGVGFEPAVPIEQLVEICWDDRICRPGQMPIAGQSRIPCSGRKVP